MFGRNTIGGAINIVTHTPGNESKISGSMTLGAYNRHDVLLTADMPISDTLLTTVSVSSQTREGYQKVVPYPADSPMGTTPYQVSGQADYPKAPGTESSSANGGQNVQALRFKMLWHASDTVDLTLAGDYTHENQSGLSNTIRSVTTANATGYIDPNSPAAGALFGPNIMGNFYNMCITTPGSALGRRPVQYHEWTVRPDGRGHVELDDRKIQGNRLMARAVRRWAAWVPWGYPTRYWRD